jgi:hypothetical protein
MGFICMHGPHCGDQKSSNTIDWAAAVTPINDEARAMNAVANRTIPSLLGLVVCMPPLRRRRRDGVTLFVRGRASRGQPMLSILLIYMADFIRLLCRSKTTLLFRATLVSEPMGVVQRRILLRGIRRCGGGIVAELCNSYKTSLIERGPPWTPEGQSLGLQ